MLEAYRAMEPVRDVIGMIKTQFAEQQRWASLDLQVQNGDGPFQVDSVSEGSIPRCYYCVRLK